MKTAVSMAYDTLSNSELMRDVDIYSNSVPETDQTIPKLPLARIVELDTSYTDFASNNPWCIEFNIQLDLWVSTFEALDTFYFAIDKIMRDAGWTNIYSEQTDDPDLQSAKRIIKRYTGRLNIE